MIAVEPTRGCVSVISVALLLLLLLLLLMLLLIHAGSELSVVSSS